MMNQIIMKPLPFLLRISLLFALPLLGARAANPPAETPELAKARADLLDAYSRGRHDDDNEVKQTKAEISRLEYIGAHTPAKSEDSAQIISVDFPGGPASALIAAIAKSSGASGFNVIGEKADLAIDLPPFSVRNADVSSLASALTGVLQPRGYVLATNGRLIPGQSPVFTLRKLYSYEAANLEDRTSLFQSFQLGPYLEYQSVDDIVGAVRAAWELDPAHNPGALRLKFHPPTGILLVSGPNAGINAVQTVLGQLRRSTEQFPKSNQKIAPPPPTEKK